MSIFRKISSGISSAFKKAPEVIGSAFKKGGTIARSFHNGLEHVNEGLAKAAKIGAQVLDNPATTALAGGVGGVQGLAALAGARRVLGGINKAEEIGKKLANLSNVDSYKSGNTIENLKDAHERAKDLAMSAPRIKFT